MVGKEAPIPGFRIDDSIRDGQMAKLAALRQRRDATIAALALETIRQKAITTENLMPAVVEAVEANCTLGEIADVLRGVYGEYK